MTKIKLDNRGVAHYMAVVGILSVVVIAGVGVTVYKAGKDSKKSNSSSANSSAAKKTTGVNEDSKTVPAALSTEAKNTPVASTTKPSTSTAPTATKTTTKPKTTTTTVTTPAPVTASQTPLSALTEVLRNLKGGANVNITAGVVTVAGPIGNAQARPIVFTVNGVKYFAYKQGSAADFSKTAAEIANTMAITTVSGSPAVVTGRLDKSGNLVDPDSSSNQVAYSTGGN